MEKNIIHLTGCSWKQASTAVCEQVMRDREAERQRQIDIQMAETYHNRMQESKKMIITPECISYGMLTGYSSNFDESRIPDVLSANGVSLTTWGKVFTASVEVFEKLRSIKNDTYWISDATAGMVLTYSFNASIAVSNFIAKANFFLNPHGILVQVEHTFQTKELVKKAALFQKGKKVKVDRCLFLMATFNPILADDVVPAAAVEVI